MDHSSSKPPKHHKGGASGSTDRQSVDPSQSGPQVAKKGAHTSSGPDGAFVTEDSSNPEVIAQNLEWQMEHMSISRGPPTTPFSTGRSKAKSSNTQPQTRRRSEVQAHPPAPFAQGPLVAVAATDEHRHPQPRTQSNQSTSGQPQQVSHAQRHQMPHGQVSHGQAHHVPRGQVHHGQTHHDQVNHVQTHQMSHGHTHHVPHGQMHAPLAYGHTPQPAQVQMPRATEGGTSSHDQQRSADTKRGKHDYMPAVTANQRASASRR